MGAVNIHPISEHMRLAVRDIYIQRQIGIHSLLFHSIHLNVPRKERLALGWRCCVSRFTPIRPKVMA